jgi:hypothetical protein
MLSAQPVGAETPISETGTVGAYEFLDTHSDYGGRCVYGANEKLKKISIRAPQNVHGAYASNTWVGWQFKIRRSVQHNSWQTIYTSSVQKDRANDAIPANDFTRRAWYLSGTPNGLYAVRVILLFYAPGSSTNVEGRVSVRYDYYTYLMGGPTDTNSSACSATFPIF